jgi:hypothetical protein
MPRQKNSRWTLLILTLSLLAVSLACSAAERLVFPTRIVPTAPDVPIDCNDDSCLDACLAHIDQVLASTPLDEVGGGYASATANFNLIVYKVDGNSITEPDILWVPSEYKAYQQDTAAHQRVWDYFTSLIPAEQRKWISEYVIFTDGSYNYAAWVNQVKEGDNSQWQLGVDILDATNPTDLTQTIIHEVGHLIFLNSDQIVRKDNFIFTPYQNATVCPQFSSYDGCSTPKSYVNQFYQTFWVGAIYDDWLKTVYKSDTQTEEEFRQVVKGFYSNHPGEFSQEYAATNINEDMAVSFANFVLSPMPTGDSVTDRKILFFYDFPELVALRKQVIHAICSLPGKK